MSIGKPAILCHYPLSPLVPSEHFSSLSFGCTCLEFIVGGL
jgi:hypothetical protein